jgi:hypothetical protein
MLYSSVSCYRCFVFQRYVQRVIGARLERCGKGRGKLGPADGARGALGVLWTGHARPRPGSRLHGERERRGLGRRSDGHGAGRGGVRMRRGMRQARKNYNDTVGVRHVSNGPLGTVR